MFSVGKCCIFKKAVAPNCHGRKRGSYLMVYEGMDPFLLQLVIIPFIVISLGLLVVWITKKIMLGVIATLLANILLELILYGANLSSWNITFPIVTLIISLLLIMKRRE